MALQGAWCGGLSLSPSGNSTPCKAMSPKSENSGGMVLSALVSLACTECACAMQQEQHRYWQSQRRKVQEMRKGLTWIPLH